MVNVNELAGKASSLILLGNPPEEGLSGEPLLRPAADRGGRRRGRGAAKQALEERRTGRIRVVAGEVDAGGQGIPRTRIARLGMRDQGLQIPVPAVLEQADHDRVAAVDVLAHLQL